MRLTPGQWLARGRWLMLLAIALASLAPDHVLDAGNHHASSDSAEAHRRHCHGEAASCSDSPVAGGVAVASVSQDLAAPMVPMLATALAPVAGLLAAIDGQVDDPPPRGA